MIIISPAKRQNVPEKNRSQGQPVGLAQAKDLLADISALDRETLTKILAVSQDIGQKSWEDFQTLQQKGMQASEAVAAIDLYQGDVFKFLDVSSLNDHDLLFMQEHLRIVSAFYGWLKPLDGIWPYRLEMTSRLPGYRGLAGFWQEAISLELSKNKPDFIFNLASQAYAQAVVKPEGSIWVDVVFQDKDRHGKFKVVAVKAKRMRGKILRYMLTNRIEHPEGLLAYQEDGYVFNEHLSSPNQLVYQAQ
ncbi:YaaA family protein [Candidatus Synchoanobacter obligatus]|uniref:UPF0246 protein MKS91_02955 n=1 Tax=Candidatus Synchoanobacter obligatus TaxID=2919597 RepID=A0ABT1L685_9GAMM|nr:YaaA family protein [Candidatus Synchoanobacter obligatus]MCP8352245.1 YaaA family protein [Candidatus Synchoanobacter obligatus]